jgi:hypothetical protein
MLEATASSMKKEAGDEKPGARAGRPIVSSDGEFG